MQLTEPLGRRPAPAAHVLLGRAVALACLLIFLALLLLFKGGRLLADWLTSDSARDVDFLIRSIMDGMASSPATNVATRAPPAQPRQKPWYELDWLVQEETVATRGGGDGTPARVPLHSMAFIVMTSAATSSARLPVRAPRGCPHARL